MVSRTTLLEDAGMKFLQDIGGVGGYTEMPTCPPHSGTPDDWFSLIIVSFTTNDFRYLHVCHINVWFEFFYFVPNEMT